MCVPWHVRPAAIAAPIAAAVEEYAGLFGAGLCARSSVRYRVRLERSGWVTQRNTVQASGQHAGGQGRTFDPVVRDDGRSLISHRHIAVPHLTAAVLVPSMSVREVLRAVRVGQDRLETCLFTVPLRIPDVPLLIRPVTGFAAPRPLCRVTGVTGLAIVAVFSPFIWGVA